MNSSNENRIDLIFKSGVVKSNYLDGLEYIKENINLKKRKITNIFKIIDDDTVSNLNNANLYVDSARIYKIEFYEQETYDFLGNKFSNKINSNFDNVEKTNLLKNTKYLNLKIFDVNEIINNQFQVQILQNEIEILKYLNKNYQYQEILNEKEIKNKIDKKDQNKANQYNNQEIISNGIGKLLLKIKEDNNNIRKDTRKSTLMENYNRNKTNKYKSLKHVLNPENLNFLYKENSEKTDNIGISKELMSINMDINKVSVKKNINRKTSIDSIDEISESDFLETIENEIAVKEKENNNSLFPKYSNEKINDDTIKSKINFTKYFENGENDGNEDLNKTNKERIYNDKILSINFKNFVRLNHAVFNNDYLFCFYEYNRILSLKDLMRKRKYLTEFEIKIILKQLLQSLLDLKKLNILYASISDNNILLTEDFQIKLSNFRNSIILEYESQTNVKTLNCDINYIPPEYHKFNTPLTYKFDVWCIGILIFFLRFGFYPFQTQITSFGINRNKNLKQIQSNKISKYENEDIFSKFQTSHQYQVLSKLDNLNRKAEENYYLNEKYIEETFKSRSIINDCFINKDQLVVDDQFFKFYCLKFKNQLSFPENCYKMENNKKIFNNKYISHDFIHLIMKLLNPDCNNRIELEDIASDPFLINTDKIPNSLTSDCLELEPSLTLIKSYFPDITSKGIKRSENDNYSFCKNSLLDNSFLTNYKKTNFIGYDHFVYKSEYSKEIGLTYSMTNNVSGVIFNNNSSIHFNRDKTTFLTFLNNEELSIVNNKVLAWINSELKLFKNSLDTIIKDNNSNSYSTKDKLNFSNSNDKKQNISNYIHEELSIQRLDLVRDKLMGNIEKILKFISNLYHNQIDKSNNNNEINSYLKDNNEIKESLNKDKEGKIKIQSKSKKALLRYDFYNKIPSNLTFFIYIYKMYCEYFHTKKDEVEISYNLNKNKIMNFFKHDESKKINEVNIHKNDDNFNENYCKNLSSENKITLLNEFNFLKYYNLLKDGKDVFILYEYDEYYYHLYNFNRNISLIYNKELKSSLYIDEDYNISDVVENNNYHLQYFKYFKKCIRKLYKAN